MVKRSDRGNPVDYYNFVLVGKFPYSPNINLKIMAVLVTRLPSVQWFFSLSICRIFGSDYVEVSGGVIVS